MQRFMVTGSTGFIGIHVVRTLVASGYDVGCLIRKKSNRQVLDGLPVEFHVAELHDSRKIAEHLAGYDCVIHLAGMTKSLHRTGLFAVNQKGTKSLLTACADFKQPPKVVLVSSLAAAGPARSERPKTESDDDLPVSNYGKSKLAGEYEARKFCEPISISILRPPIVLGEGDRDGLEMFKGIAKSGLHLVPTRKDHHFSVVHVSDLVNAILLVAYKGERINTETKSSGLYYVEADMTPTYAQLGTMIGKAVGRKTKVFHVHSPAVWIVGFIANMAAQITRKPFIMSLDKAREATAGSWCCSADKLQKLGFKIEKPLADRLSQTADWYREHGWIE